MFGPQREQIDLTSSVAAKKGANQRMPGSVGSEQVSYTTIASGGCVS